MLALTRQEFIFSDPTPTPECHASTVLKLADGRILAAWFAGTKEKADDVQIWLSRRDENGWTAPKAVTPPMGVPQWNPVLFQMDERTAALFYKVDKPIADWYTMVIYTTDGGDTWTEPQELVPGDRSGGRGPVKNKALRLSNGRVIGPASVERGPWRPFADVTDDGGRTWVKRPMPVEAENADEINLIQPTLWESEPGHVHALLRSNEGHIWRSDSADYGETWSPCRPTEMLNNNSGLDAVRLADGTVLLACNPVGDNWGSRSPLSIFASKDNGAHFEKLIDLENTPGGEFSYPGIIVDGDAVHVVYTWNRKKIVYCELKIG